MISVKKEKLEPFMKEIFQVISNVFKQYEGTSMITLYDIIVYMTEEYETYFKDPGLSKSLLDNILEKFYNVKEDDFKNLSPIYDLLCSVIRASGELLKNFCNDFILRSLTIIDNLINLYKKDQASMDKELLSKCCELIGVICNFLPGFCREILNNSTIMNYLFLLLNINDNYIKQNIFSLIGDLSKTKFKISRREFREYN